MHRLDVYGGSGWGGITAKPSQNCSISTMLFLLLVPVLVQPPPPFYSSNSPFFLFTFPISPYPSPPCPRPPPTAKKGWAKPGSDSHHYPLPSPQPTRDPAYCVASEAPLVVVAAVAVAPPLLVVACLLAARVARLLTTASSIDPDAHLAVRG